MLNDNEQLLVYRVQYINSQNEQINLGIISYEPNQYSSLVTITPNLKRILELQPTLKANQLIDLINYVYEKFNQKPKTPNSKQNSFGEINWVEKRFKEINNPNIKITKIFENIIPKEQVIIKIHKIINQQL